MNTRMMFARVVAGAAICISAAVGAAEEPDMPGVAPEPAGGWKTKAICLSAPASKDVGRFCTFVKDTLKPSGVEAVVLLVRYKYKFTSHPECATKDAMSLAEAKAIKRACDDAGVRLIPKMNLLGHQSGNTISDGLLKAYPELDESPEKTNVRYDYCRSICPKHPDSLRIVTDLADELVEAFGADAMHIGCDEVFEIGNCPRCKDTPTSKLFADWVNGIARHLKARGVSTMIWGDRLLDAKATGYGVWEASDNGTSDALKMLDKDIAICDWHYEDCPAYKSVDIFADAGRKIYLCPWRYSENTQKFLDYAVAHDRGQYLGILFTTWCSCEDLMDVLEGKGVLRHKPDSKSAKTLLALRRNFRYLFPKSKYVLCGAEEKFANEAELPKLDALAFKSEGSMIYGQVLVPSSKFAGPRPCVIFCHGFAGFTRWDDVAHDLCRAGIAVVIPHHRGAWGSEGEYTVTGCIKDAENLARWATGAETAAKYGLDTNAVYLVGHSMGGNSVVNAAARLPGVRGVALVAPCDIGYMAQNMSREELKRFLVGEGMLVLRRASDDSIVDDIIAHAAEMRFERTAKAFEGKKVFLATAEYDKTVPTEPLDSFWAKLGDGVQKRRKAYHAGHSLMGARLAFASDLKDFVFAGKTATAYAVGLSGEAP